ncbi:MBOAT family protein [Moritella sp. 28]|nr:MBOAT family protein [Moritella sp. 28]
MIFSSPIFLFIFLPIVFILHSLFKEEISKKSILVLSSLIFYAWWEPSYLILMVASISINYLLYQLIVNGHNKSKLLTIIGVVFNVSLLAYFKYSYFIVDNISYFIGDVSIEKILLPLGISFFTFQQIAFLVDSYKNDTDKYNLLDYTLFVTFFPQLIAGPIVHHKEMMPQFKYYKKTNPSRIIKGFIIFTIGMFKKLIVADTFSIWADTGFSNVTGLTFFSAWLTTISYTVQLYYDFSGYCDMAIGLALIFNIKLPINFNSPYKASNIQDFWHRWHITLSTWLKDYIYIPLGGNRNGHVSASFNVFMTFLIGGLWHGAGWNFIIWGGMHGAALAIHRAWSYSKLRMPTYISWFLTIMFVHFAWVFFRAENVSIAITVITKMLNFNLDISNIRMFSANAINFPLTSPLTSSIIMIIFLFVIILCTIVMKNSLEITKYNNEEHVFSTRSIILYGMLLGFVSLSMFMTSTSSFLYFNF